LLVQIACFCSVHTSHFSVSILYVQVRPHTVPRMPLSSQPLCSGLGRETSRPRVSFSSCYAYHQQWNPDSRFIDQVMLIPCHFNADPCSTPSLRIHLYSSF
jgi:hypothetical protein